MNVKNAHITIDGLKVYAYHGVLPIERSVGNLFEISIDLYYDALTAMKSDNIDTALNYASVVSLVTQIMAVPEHLLEHVCFKIATKISYKFSEITEGTVTIKKLKPPIPEQMDSVGFTLHWTK
jgi:dihydroneopterin aldolase